MFPYDVFAEKPRRCLGHRNLLFTGESVRNYEAWEGPRVILEAVRAEAPEYADILEKNYSKPFTCNLNPNSSASPIF